jgi:hypothetical protein
MRTLICLSWLILLLGCSRKQTLDSQAGDGGAPAARNASEKKDDLMVVDENTPPEEKRFLEAGKPFVVAIAARRYAQAFEMLSSHARAQMSLNQFLAPEDEAQLKSNQEHPIQNATAEQFCEQLRMIEQRFGPPRQVGSLSVQSVDPKILAGQITEPMDKLDVMFAIGMMPDTIASDIRRASLRAQIKTDWNPEDLKKAAQDMQTTEDEVRKDSDGPYFNLKFVLVEDAGQLKVGYFEFMPPSMLD